jgi:glycosyltransferase involved in cell wall biosynthesis
MSLRILHVIPDIDPSLGGPVTSISNLGRAMKLKGNDVNVVTLRRSSNQAADFDFPVHFVGRTNSRYCFSLRLFFWLWSNARAYDILVINGMWQFHGICTLIVHLAKGIPYVIYPHGMLTSYCVRTDSLKYIKKYIYWITIEYWVVRSSGGVITTSDSEASSSAASLPGTSKLTFFVTGGGIQDPCSFSSQIKYHEKDTNRLLDSMSIPGPLGTKGYLLYLGRMDAIKGIDILMEAYALAKGVQEKFQLVIAGGEDGAYYESLKLLESKLNLDGRIVWVGSVSGLPKWRLLQEASALVLASHHENFSNVTVEALAVGTPVLTTDKVGVSPNILEWNAGIVGGDTLTDFCKILEEWSAKDIAEIQRFRSSARRCYLNNFSDTAWATRVERALNSAIG